MKISKNLYTILVTNLAESSVTVMSTIEQLENDYKLAGHSTTRFVWDLFWRSKNQSHFLTLAHGENLNDTHIETALKNAVKELKAQGY